MPLTKEDKLELFELLEKEVGIRLSSLMPRSERLRIIDELLKDPSSPIPQEVARTLPEAVRLEFFDQGVEKGAIKLG